RRDARRERRARPGRVPLGAEGPRAARARAGPAHRARPADRRREAPERRRVGPRPSGRGPAAVQHLRRGARRDPCVVAREGVRRPPRAPPGDLLTKIAIAQCAPALGAFKRNMAMHEDWIAKARSADARLVVFPELSLTGYYLKDLAGEVACASDDARLGPIVDASRQIDICAGFVERGPDARLHIAQGYWSGGRLVHVHRKVYLPTYGIFDDGRYF